MTGRGPARETGEGDHSWRSKAAPHANGSCGDNGAIAKKRTDGGEAISGGAEVACGESARMADFPEGCFFEPRSCIRFSPRIPSCARKYSTSSQRCALQEEDEVVQLETIPNLDWQPVYGRWIFGGPTELHGHAVRHGVDQHVPRPRVQLAVWRL